MTKHRIPITSGALEPEKLRQDNYRAMTDDRLRCQGCQGFYWRLWYDMAQCVGCQRYTRIEVGDSVPTDQMEFDFVDNEHSRTLLSVAWIREQLLHGGTICIDDRIKDPLSGRGEFVIYANRLHCRVTGVETELAPKISGTWILEKLPHHKTRVLSAKEALSIVAGNKNEA